MHVLVIGGNRFVGQLLVWRLLAARHRVTVLNRGNLGDPFGARVERLRADRTTDAFDAAVKGKAFDATVDFAAFHGEDVERVERTLGRRAGHYLLISTGQVYLVAPEAPRPAREEHFALPVMAEPDRNSADWKEWEYGIGKRACELAVEAAERRGALRATRLRLPMVNGERDYYRRLESYWWRILDGGPVLIAKGRGDDCRHVYGADVAETILKTLGQESAMGQAFNLSQDQSLPLRKIIERLGQVMGAGDVKVLEPTAEQVTAAGLVPEKISPFSQRWMSCLDPARAKKELGFRPTEFETYVHSVVASLSAHAPAQPPDSDDSRAKELELASQLMKGKG